MSWTEAKALCEKMGGHLATVSDDVEGFIIKYVISDGKSDAYWLGATSNGSTDGNFRWVTGESFTYTDWEKGEPSNSEQNGDKEMYLEVRKSYNSR